MAIDRGPWNALQDDDGSNLVGTLWNKDKIKTVLLDPIDQLVGAPQAWTPIDGSGAGLVFAVTMAQAIRIGKLVGLFVQLNYPATSNGANAVIRGLPAVAAVTGGLYVSYGMANTAYIGAGTADVQLIVPGTGTPRTNADLSGAVIVLAGVYLST